MWFRSMVEGVAIVPRRANLNVRLTVRKPFICETAISIREDP